MERRGSDHYGHRKEEEVGGGGIIAMKGRKEGKMEGRGS